MKKNEFESLPPIDVESALERTGDDRSFLHELIEMYIEDFKLKFSELREAVKHTDFSKILELSHYLKGSSANLSLEPLRESFYHMELCGREHDATQASQVLTTLQFEFDRLVEFFTGMEK